MIVGLKFFDEYKVQDPSKLDGQLGLEILGDVKNVSVVL